MNPHSRPKQIWYSVCRAVCRIFGVVVFGVRVRGRQKIPRDGGLLIVSNHQSHLDPVLAGVACDRQMSSLARDTLFLVPLLRPLIKSLDAIPLDREGGGLAGLKETLRRLKKGDVVLVFPEGTRTPDGRLGSLKSGFCTLARRTGVPLQPMAIAGAFDAWPRRRLFPGQATIHVEFGQPLMPELIERLSDEQLVAEVHARIRACQQNAEAHRRRAVVRLPALPAISPCGR